MEKIVRLLNFLIENNVNCVFDYNHENSLVFEMYGIADLPEKVYLTIRRLISELGFSFEENEDMEVIYYSDDFYTFNFYY